jgi:diguanylate cyclase (GGDEF)-like protein
VVEKAICFNERISVLMLDLDFFKDVNDRYGHQTGDTVLKAVAGVVSSNLDESDILGRYGGEEFAIVLSDEKSLSALAIAESIRKGVENLRNHHGSDEIRLTVSIGVAQRGFGNNDITLEYLLAEADRALYRAKRGGRNMVCSGPSSVDAQ